jgi:hypothetical protein
MNTANISTRVSTLDETRIWNTLKPTHIGTVMGIKFHEHPELGDESELITYDDELERWVVTQFWDLPELHEVKDCY